MNEKTVIIADSLTNDFFGVEDAYLQVKVNVGRREAVRMMGGGEDGAVGPLAGFLLDAADAAKNTGNVLIIMLRDLHDPADPLQMPELFRFGNHNVKGTPGAEFVNAVRDVLPHAVVIDTDTLSMPVAVFHAAMKRFLGGDVLGLTAQERSLVRFVVTGVYSDIRVAATAAKLRNEYRFHNVFVCPHLCGSKNPRAHIEALQHVIPDALVQVLPSMSDVYKAADIIPSHIDPERFSCAAIHPESFSGTLDQHRRAAVQTAFLFYDRLDVTPLSGGFSGGLLLLVRGEKNGAAAQPQVVKIDLHEKMRHELEGYELVRDFAGKLVPAFSGVVFHGPYCCVRMELASLEGAPETLQRSFERAGDAGDMGDRSPAASVQPLLDRLGTVLDVLGSRLYANTMTRRELDPLTAFGLDDPMQRRWLRENVSCVIGRDPDEIDSMAQFHIAGGLECANFLPLFDRLLARRQYFLKKSPVCIVHGDLNLANILFDGRENPWVIDWSYAGVKPAETDFAKLENDVKFIVEKDFSEIDLPRLLEIEKFLTNAAELPSVSVSLSKLPPEIGFFIADDVRFLKLYESVRLIRRAYGAVTGAPVGRTYRTALLKYSMHTLSFDRRRGRGECGPVELAYALLSTSLLLEKLSLDAPDTQAVDT